MKKNRMWVLAVIMAVLLLVGNVGLSIAAEPSPKTLNIGTHP